MKKFFRIKITGSNLDNELFFADQSFAEQFVSSLVGMFGEEIGKAEIKFEISSENMIDKASDLINSLLESQMIYNKLKTMQNEKPN